MPHTLVIVESPAKAKTIGRYLGADYTISASVGHIRDLPSGTLGVDVKNHYKPIYIPMRGKASVIKELKQKASTADRVLLATDPDREGEAIAWHLATVLKIDPASPCRISFNEITKTAVQEAVNHPRPIDLTLVDAQQARRILDRLVGYELSPLLWKKIRKGLSAGRVQSVATRMIVEREEEIEAFKPEEYWTIEANLETDRQGSLIAHYSGDWDDQGKYHKRVIRNEREAQELVASCAQNPYTVHALIKRSRKRKPYAPFTTSTLQQDASRRLGFTSRRTMSVAQQLYEGIDLPGEGPTALVTYIRTDSVRSSREAVEEIRQLIKKQFGSEYLPKSPQKYSNKNAAQDAHEAIRPSHFHLPPEKIKEALTADQFRLYRLIWERFLASQMNPAELDGTTVEIKNGSAQFRATGEILKFPGYLKVYGDTETSDNKILPDLKEKENLLCRDLKSEQKFTQPPARFNEASLIKAMEEAGIGRPSTYAPTLSTIQDRNYAEKVGKALAPTDLGRLVTDLLRTHFDEFINVGFTAQMESELDHVEEAQRNWEMVLDHFYSPFHERIAAATEQIEKIEMPVVETGETCPECNHPLVIKEGRYGKFISCSNFPACSFTKSLEEDSGSHCPKCGGTLLVRKSRRGKIFYLCKKNGDRPDCDFISWDLPIDGSSCPECGSYQVWRRVRGRLYRTCSNLDCPTRARKKAAKTTPLQPVSEPEPSEDFGSPSPAERGKDHA